MTNLQLATRLFRVDGFEPPRLRQGRTVDIIVAREQDRSRAVDAEVSDGKLESNLRPLQVFRAFRFYRPGQYFSPLPDFPDQLLSNRFLGHSTPVERHKPHQGRNLRQSPCSVCVIAYASPV